MRTAFINGRVLTDAGLEEGVAVVIEGERIAEVAPRADVRLRGAEVVDLEGNLLLPGFIDVQVNGGGGVLFNDTPTVDAIAEIGRVHRQFGTTGFLPTLVSDDLDVVAEAISATREAIAKGVPGVLGLHIEGPFLNEARRGVHDASKIRTLDEEAFRLLTTPTGGKTLITLAPEKTTPAMIHALTRAGIIVSAGHSDATYAQVREALAAGLTGFTHLFNAMSQLTVREPGVVGAALDDQNSWCSIIVDGHHVDPVVLRLAMRMKRHDRFILVTDAMPSVGADVKSFNLLNKRITVRDGVCTDESGNLAGSDVDMATAVRNSSTLLDIKLTEAIDMGSKNPAAFLGVSDDYGRIAPGRRAALSITSNELEISSSWIDGRRP